MNLIYVFLKIKVWLFISCILSKTETIYNSIFLYLPTQYHHHGTAFTWPWKVLIKFIVSRWIKFF